MKRLLIAILILSMGAVAEEAAKIEEPAKAEVCPAKDWPSLNELWNETESGNELQRVIPEIP